MLEIQICFKKIKRSTFAWPWVQQALVNQSTCYNDSEWTKSPCMCGRLAAEPVSCWYHDQHC